MPTLARWMPVEGTHSQRTRVAAGADKDGEVLLALLQEVVEQACQHLSTMRDFEHRPALDLESQILECQCRPVPQIAHVHSAAARPNWLDGHRLRRTESRETERIHEN